MKLKLDENGHVVVVDNKPIYIHDDSKEAPFDAESTVATISRLNGEAKANRERAEAAEKLAKTFDGITDPAAAIKALQTVANLDMKKLVDAGEVDKVKAEISRAFEAQLADATNKASDLEQQLYSEKIGGSFARSRLIADKLAIPVDMVQARFGNAFKVEDGKTVAYDHQGNKIYSRSRPGELADFDESLEVLIDQYPHKEHILKSAGGTGSGAGNASKGNAMRESEFNALTPKDRALAMEKGVVIID